MTTSAVETAHTRTRAETPSSVTLSTPTLQESKAQVLYGPKELRLIARTIAPPAEDEVQVAIRSTTLCGSDVHYYMHHANGDIKIREPLSPGHESAGEIVAVGKHVTSFRVGDRVALEVGVPCSLPSCEACNDGEYNLCEEMRFRSSAASFPHFQGTLQERVNHPARWCHHLPDDIGCDAGALLEPLSVAVHAHRKAGLKAGASVLVMGAGAMGLMCATAARAAGCADVTMMDIATNRLQFALDNGFADAICVSQGPARGTVLSTEEKLAVAQKNASLAVEAKAKAGCRKGPFHATFECSGVESCVQTAIYVRIFSPLEKMPPRLPALASMGMLTFSWGQSKATRPGGKVLLIGMGTPVESLPISVATRGEIGLLGVWRYANTYPRAIEIMQAAGKLGGNVPDLQKLLTHRFGLGAATAAFQTAARTSDDDGNLVIKVVVNN
ncbi:Alcohol dehydrogenase superfamily, zinc-type [Niveomyces insectorum RCEF 264]|uniref:Alcohol dehydrogenase superfamily, zinc-type n=1 Tax=Niveomyces insectorum RCEF 264 TaxID=1081102 RepID=A0A167XTZ8_9HYPO|nr:Alcohol dehydrogenase superfamily, zinc-type [Niveomyces insectorum RCEF 264]